MATFPPSKDERDANLDALKDAVLEWGEKEAVRLEEETQFLRDVLQGRGASDAGSTNLEAGSELLQRAVTDFILSAEEIAV